MGEGRAFESHASKTRENGSKPRGLSFRAPGTLAMLAVARRSTDALNSVSVANRNDKEGLPFRYSRELYLDRRDLRVGFTADAGIDQIDDGFSISRIKV